MLVLGIETSCDETSVALYDSTNGKTVCKTDSQIDIHTKFGGVVPEVASRNHILKVSPLFHETLNTFGAKPEDIDLIGVTNAPGLIGALFVGVSYAKSLALTIKRPLVPVNHLTAHILAAEIENKELKPPYAALIISGGHTHIYDVDAAYNFKLLARTIDDAAGESFDKVAKMMGLGYPGGPHIEKLAEQGDPTVKLPIAMPKDDNFSFSGLKTAVLYAFNKNEHTKADIASSFQKTITDTLIKKTLRLLKAINREKLVIAGGVACNGYLRKAFKEKQHKNFQVFFPSPKLCTDNGEMIAYTAYTMYRKRKFLGLSGTAYDQDPYITK